MTWRVELRREDFERMLAHAREWLPAEACGLIAGHARGGVKRIERVYLLTNVDRSNEHFTIDPKEHLAAVRDARSRGLEMLGNWHSHPESPSRQSEEDKRLSYDHSASYLIVSLMAEEPVIHSFHFDGSESTQEDLVIV